MKRNLDMEGDASQSKRARAGERYRFLITNPIAGVVIGKGGETVRSIREQCAVGLNIMKSDGYPDRVMVVQGEVSNVAQAVCGIVENVIATNAKQSNHNSSDPRLLVHAAHCGAIIGKGGATIKETMANTGAKITISSQPLPGSTEKVCEIAGTPTEIQAALEAVLLQLKEHPLRPGTSVVNYMSGPAAPTYPQAGPAFHHSGYDPNGAGMQQAFADPYAGMGMGMGPGMQGNISQSPSGDSTPGASEIEIPAVSVGAVIGKAGATIKFIQQNSACTVVISDRQDAVEATSRKISIKGPCNRIPIAIFLIRQALEQQQGEALDGPQQVQELVIEAVQAGVLIGKRGQTVQELKKYSGCGMVNIAKPSEEDPTHRTVTLKGSAFHLQCALAIIQCTLGSQLELVTD